MTAEPMSNRQVRAAAVSAAAAFCAPCETSTPGDVVRIAEQFADYIATGKPFEDAWPS